MSQTWENTGSASGMKPHLSAGVLGQVRMEHGQRCPTPAGGRLGGFIHPATPIFLGRSRLFAKNGSGWEQ